MIRMVVWKETACVSSLYCGAESYIDSSMRFLYQIKIKRCQLFYRCNTFIKFEFNEEYR